MPRPLLLCATTEDQGMPLKGVERFAAAARQAYAAAQAGTAFALHVDPGPHALTLPAFRHAQEWLKAHLGACPGAVDLTSAAPDHGGDA